MLRGGVALRTGVWWGVVVAFHVVWVTLSTALLAVFGLVGPGRLGWRALVLGAFGTGSVLAGFLQGFLLLRTGRPSRLRGC